jgi:hypothetical protein
VPEKLAAQRRLPSPADALRALQRAALDADLDALAAAATPAHERLILEELYLLELGLALRATRSSRAPGHRDALRRAAPAHRRCASCRSRSRAPSSAPWRELAADLAQPHR